MEITLVRYSTREMVDVKHAMAYRAEVLKHARSHGVDRHHVDRAIDKQDLAIRTSIISDTAGQIEPGKMDPVSADAWRRRFSPMGSELRSGMSPGRSVLRLSAAREAWERQGCTVHCAAFSGSQLKGWRHPPASPAAHGVNGSRTGNRTLGGGDAFVIEEAGMIGSRQLARFVGEAERSGAKIVLVGDHEQLQAIGAGHHSGR